MFKKQLSLVFGIIVTSVALTSTASADTSFRRISSGWVGAIQPGTSASFNWQCNSNEKVVSGGFRSRSVANNGSNGFHIIHSYPITDQRWHFRLRNADDAVRDVSLYIVCAK